MTPQIITTSKITDHHNKCNSNEEDWNTAKIIKMWQRQEVRNPILKVALINLLDAGLHKISIYRKKKKLNIYEAE